MRKFFDKKLIVNLVISFITIVVALVNIFIFSGQFAKKSKKATAQSSYNYYTIYTPIFTRDLQNRSLAGPGGAISNTSCTQAKAYAYEIFVRDGAGNDIAREYWYAPEFYVNLANSSGSRLNCDEEQVFFLGTGNFVTAAGAVFGEGSFRSTSFETLRAVLEGLFRQYNVRVITPDRSSCDVTLMIREDNPWANNPCFIRNDDCTSQFYADQSFNWVNQCSPMMPQRWLIRGVLYD